MSVPGLEARHEEINLLVREHEVGADWPHRETAATLHGWFDRFNAEFFQDRLPTGFLQLDPSRRRGVGGYRGGRNGVGALHEINLDLRQPDRPLCAALAAMLHCMVHEWQELYGTPGKRGYHNREFAEKCEALGIPCSSRHRCTILRLTDPLAALLRRESVEIDMRALLSGPEKGSSPMKKWTCGCTNIRAAVMVDAQCLRCGEHFRREE